jgi:hypothetical protein
MHPQSFCATIFTFHFTFGYNCLFLGKNTSLMKHLHPYLLTFLISAFLFSCNNTEEREAKAMEEIYQLAKINDSLNQVVRKDMRVIQNNIGQMVNRGLSADQLVVHVDSYKSEERRYKEVYAQWKVIRDQALSSSPESTMTKSAVELRDMGKAVNDSLSMVATNMQEILQNTETILSTLPEAPPIEMPEM